MFFFDSVRLYNVPDRIFGTTHERMQDEVSEFVDPNVVMLEQLGICSICDC